MSHTPESTAAFSKVSRTKHIEKRKSYGIEEYLVDWLRHLQLGPWGSLITRTCHSVLDPHIVLCFSMNSAGKMLCWYVETLGSRSVDSIVCSKRAAQGTLNDWGSCFLLFAPTPSNLNDKQLQLSCTVACRGSSHM